MLTNRNKPMTQEVLDALPDNYYVVNLNRKSIVQTNNKKVKAGTACYAVLFNRTEPCKIKEGQCICQLNFSDNKKNEFYISDETAGSPRHFKVKGSLLKKQLALITVQDQTDFLEQKEAFKQNTKRLQRAEQLAKFGYWEFDVQTEVFTTSLGGKLIYGLEKNEITLEEVRTFNLEAYQDLFDSAMKALIKEGQGFDIPYKIRRKNDNQIRSIRALATYLPARKMAFGIVHDVTDTEKLDIVKRQHQEYLSLLFENMNNAFAQHRVVTNDNGQISDVIVMDVNPSYETLFGIKRENIQNKSIRTFFPDLSDEWVEKFGQVALTGKAEQFIDYFSSLEKFLEISIYSPGQGYFVTSINDVTKRVEAEIELKETKEKAVESDRLKTLFLANMSHEIRTPLNGILGFSNLLSQDGLSNENRLYYGKIIENSGKRLMTIIDDIIDVSMIQSDQIKIDYTEIDVNELLNEIFTVYTKEKAEKLTRIKFKIKPITKDEPCLFYSDKSRLFQVLNNLLDNAFKFTEHGSIEFGVESIDQKQVVFFVKDTGRGIRVDKQDYIFDSFRQAEEGQTRSHEGFGLGLAIVAGIVEKLDGKILLDSVPGKGSVFKIVLPHNRLPKNTTRDEPNRDNVFAHPKMPKKVVSFEDEEISIALLRTVVQRQGYEVINFINAREGIEYLRKNSADLVLMDVKLPDVNGYEATKIIKKEFPDLPVVIQTAYAMADDRKAAFESGCDDLIAKPLTIDAIHRQLHKHLEVKE
ncbi:ATP-binding protein [uncultured Draconibacterium sp.]|uniref:hybrid sensor histidine kinase/response regulator n=1 Tax=uncultured Draconibacterium sp. TaxID=1573823 RepID=UPI003261BDAE